MPRRLLGVRQPCLSAERFCMALEGERDGPSIDEIIASQDQKLQEVKQNVFNGFSIPIKLMAESPVCLSSILDLPSPALMISTHYNDHKQSIIQDGGTSDALLGSEPSQKVTDVDIDFSKAENLFLLEAPIDARKDHNMLKLAYAIPKRTFMSRLLRRYPINRKRLAFIQRRPSPVKSVEMVGNMIVSVKGRETKEVTISCQVCGQKFGHQHQFQRHILTHPDPESKKFLCQICGKRFNRADHLNRHAILHGEVKVHKCLLCGEEFDRASHLDRHRRKHHPPAGQQPSQTPPSTPLLKSPPVLPSSPPSFDGFMSNIINPGTPVDQPSSGHNLHLLAAVATPDRQSIAQAQPVQIENLGVNGEHQIGMQMTDPDHVDLVPTTGGPDSSAEPEPERPYPCEVCGRKFIRATHLRRHMRIHTGEKPFACHICGRRYARGDYLRAHIHAHRRDKIHKCKHCGEVFHDLTRFADHCRLLHKDLDDQFGNPKPPPESSPPPPSFSTMLETSLIAEQAEEITVVPSINMDIASSSVPITLVTLPEPTENDVINSSVQPPTHSNSISHTPMTSPELQLAQLQALAAQTDAHLLIQNGQLQIADTTNEVTVFSHSPHGKATPISYIDTVTQYIYSGSNNNVTTIFPTPQPSPLISQSNPHSC